MGGVILILPDDDDDFRQTCPKTANIWKGLKSPLTK